MKLIRPTLFLCLCLLLSGASGCRAFRAMFSRDSSSRSDRRENRSSRRSSRSDDRDPVRDMFKIKNKPAYMHDKNLTPQERALLHEQLDSNDSMSARKSFRSTYESEQKKRRDWVFSR